MPDEAPAKSGTALSAAASAAAGLGRAGAVRCPAMAEDPTGPSCAMSDGMLVLSLPPEPFAARLDACNPEAGTLLAGTIDRSCRHSIAQ